MPKIMIVDDDTQLAKVIAHKLRRAGHEAAAFGNGEEALKALPAERPDLILLEVMIPGIAGFELLPRLLAAPDGAKIPCIFLSSRNLEEDMLRGLSLGAIDYITKPFSVNVLCAKITNVLKLLHSR